MENLNKKAANEILIPYSSQIAIATSHKADKKPDLTIMKNHRSGKHQFQIANAGLVILWPYLRLYFQQLGLLENNQFKDIQDQEKALYLLQYLASDNEFIEEDSITLNKILCNWDIKKPLSRAVTLSKRDKYSSGSLINAIIQQWSIIGKTSKQNLQKTFLLRNGFLEYTQKGWILKVKKGDLDKLLEHIPWGFSMIKLNWMEQPLYVEW